MSAEEVGSGIFEKSISLTLREPLKSWSSKEETHGDEGSEKLLGCYFRKTYSDGSRTRTNDRVVMVWYFSGKVLRLKFLHGLMSSSWHRAYVYLLALNVYVGKQRRLVGSHGAAGSALICSVYTEEDTYTKARDLQNQWHNCI